ncbi:hypothetical protein [Salinibacterium sp. ZJ454]|uniref:hypothetical protein n=1 Tax=Salinibacterium sp. ZJ454 TaxID=2708339 RepID=UPI00141D98FD|nr:hypothetical protein [Salinibacterium sp. ZJ454]
MFARVSTYQTGPDFTATSMPEETMDQVLALPECRGVYFLNATDSTTALTISLWESRDAMTSSREAVNPIRSELSEKMGMDILSTEEFEVLRSKLTQ